MKKAIVTGASGYIGSVLCKMLKEHDYHVIGIDWNPRDHDLNYDSKYCDDFIDVEYCWSMDAIDPDVTVFHLAASSLLGPSATQPLEYFENNTGKSLVLFKHLKPTNRLIFASTAAVYGHNKGNRNTPKYEEMDLNPPNNYGLSKLWCEQMLDSCYKLNNLQATSFRFFNVIGAYGDRGQQKGTPHIINKLCESADSGEPFIIYGNDWWTPDGTCVRDYVHVEDICRAMIHADKYMKEQNTVCHHKFNLGTRTGTSVKEIVDIFRTIVKDVNIKYGERREGDPAFLVADPSLFCQNTKFNYKYNNDDLYQIIDGAWRFYNGF
jgi:UDP-glucose 4-epimerase